ncbi:MAG: hypothetical protein A07HR67_02466 [uncultured archaeon A07HR67]|nr:MAG: hypothetical protein A07HR67_02466 [uncultured archaeon A07HR67]
MAAVTDSDDFFEQLDEAGQSPTTALTRSGGQSSKQKRTSSHHGHWDHQYRFVSWWVRSGMSLTSDDFEEFVSSDPDDDETIPLGQALSELGLDVEVDSVEAVRDVRERL